MLFFYLLLVICVEVIIQPYSSSGEVSFLTTSLKIENATLDEKKVYWNIHTNHKNAYRISYDEYFLDISRKNDDLIKKSGGESLKKFNEDSKIREIKKYLEKEEDKNNEDKNENKNKIETGENADDRSSTNNSKDDTTKAYKPKDNSTTNKENNNAAKSSEPKKKKVIRDPIIEKGSALLGDEFFDSLTPEFFNNLVENEGYMMKNEPESKKKEELKENGNENRKEITTPKTDILENKQTKKNNQKSNLVEAKDDDEAKKNPENQGITSGTRRSGFAFEFFPVFFHMLDKRSLIRINDKCLTHSLKFKPCVLNDFWSLDEEFYWNIYKAENTSILNGLRKMINNKERSNDDVKKNLYARPENCSNRCPSGDCENKDIDNSTTETNININQKPQNIIRPNPPNTGVMINTAFPVPQQNRSLQNTAFSMPQQSRQPYNKPLTHSQQGQNASQMNNKIALSQDLMKKLLEAVQKN